jgi:hypothetical protein
MMYEYAVAFVVGGVGGLLLGSILYEPRERRPLFRNPPVSAALPRAFGL